MDKLGDLLIINLVIHPFFIGIPLIHSANISRSTIVYWCAAEVTLTKLSALSALASLLGELS